MNRRRFLYYSTAILLTIPAYRFSQEFLNAEPFLNPPLLEFINQEQVLIIGAAYLVSHPLENTSEKLRRSIIENYKYSFNPLDRRSFKYFITNKIKTDFKDGRIILCNGWVLAITEARQCALLSLN